MHDHYKNRQYIIQGFFMLIAFMLAIKCLQLQVLDVSYRELAHATAVEKIPIYPSRGLIYDRNKKLLVNNKAVYDLMVTYNQVKDIDTLKFCSALGISREEFEQNLNKDFEHDIRFNRRKPFVFLKKIPAEIYARFQENMYEFPGFFVQLRNTRSYPYRVGAHVLGYMREVNKQEIEDNKGVYDRGDYIGVQGLEFAYEDKLRGVKGVQYMLKDNFGRLQDSYEEGLRDVPAISGENLVSSIDADLEAYGEQLMRNKRGSIVAIEPATGDVLTMLSTPTYDPNLLAVNMKRGEVWGALLRDTLKPLFDRSIRAQYPPGSIFKAVMALIGMQEGVWNEDRGFGCGGGYYYGGSRPLGCHHHPYPSDVKTALQHSCNSYFSQLFREMVEHYGYYNAQQGLDTLAARLNTFGLGVPLGIDLYDEKKGNIPTSKYYNKIYPKERGGWRAPTIISLGIGQGEVQMTTLQMANLAAIIANEGYYVTPHLAKYFIKPDGTEDRPIYEKHLVPVAQHHFTPVKDGMEMAVLAGTATRAQVPGISVCGKTGTSQNSGTDHSVFYAFAPKENPKIAIAVFIENAGFGGTHAAPIASLMIEKYLTGKISEASKAKEKRSLETDLLGAK
jgi:penicillin-binding protein 2